MKAYTHTHYRDLRASHANYPQPTNKRKARSCADIWKWKKIKQQSGENETERVLYEREESESKKNGNNTRVPRARLEIVPIRVIKLSRPGIRCHNALNTIALRPAPITSARSPHPWNTPGPVLGTPSAMLDGNGRCARTSLRFRLFALLDDLVFAIIGGGNAGTAYKWVQKKKKKTQVQRVRGVAGMASGLPTLRRRGPLNLMVLCVKSIPQFLCCYVWRWGRRR
jgi:hypothetical protein